MKAAQCFAIVLFLLCCSCSPLRHAAGLRQQDSALQQSHTAALRDTIVMATEQTLTQTVIEFYPILQPVDVPPLPEEIIPDSLPQRNSPRQMVKSITRTEYSLRSQTEARRDSVVVDTLSVQSNSQEETSYGETEKSGAQGATKTVFICIAIVAVCLLLIVLILKFIR